MRRRVTPQTKRREIAARGGGPLLADLGPPERRQHGLVLKMTARAAAEHALDHLLRLGVIDAAMRAAGLEMKRDFREARLENRIIASYNAGRSMNSGGFREYERNDMEEEAYRRWRMAVQAVGMIDSNLVLDVCCYGRMPDDAAYAALRRGLGRLEAWYRGGVEN